MEYKLKSGSPEKQTSACLVVPVNGSKLSNAALQLDEACEGYISKLVKRGDLARQPGKTLLIPGLHNVKAQRVLLVNTGKERSLSANKFTALLQGCMAALQDCSAKDAIFYLEDIHCEKRDLAWKVRHCIQTAADSLYQFNELKSDKAEAPKLTRIQFGLTGRSQTTLIETAVAQGQAIAKGKQFTKTLGNLPGNICTPSYLAEQAQQFAKSYKSVSTSILDEKQMEELGMGSLLSVSAGSAEPAKLIVMNYKGGKKDEAPQVLVGKGITFDTGGISLKPGAAMDEMKYDMCGAASVFGTLLAVAELNLPINVVGIIAAAENMPSGVATKPGDIVTTLSGKTVEILNTDAEGRLVLCDALTYAEMFNPAAIIDIATLTGACIIALGHHTSAVLSNQNTLAQQIIKAGDASADAAWQLPMGEQYQEQLKSNFADIANIGGRPAGTITAACFLSRFTEGQRWAHLDIAGTAWVSGNNKGATGRPVPLLTQYLLDRVAEQN
ncbi:MAG: leucyl aminopeptidase [Pseudomonadales bacterium]|jgi:leucyl aminopeptidase